MDASTWTGELPDDVWLAKADWRVTTWGLTSTAGGTPDAMWPDNQRIHQFQIGGSITVQGQPYSPIDRDIEDATIISSNVPKEPVLTAQQKNYVACQTVLYGINNYNYLAGLLVGTGPPVTDQGLLDYYTPSGGDNWNLLSLSYPNGMASINNLCGVNGCAYRSTIQNTAVGFEVPVPEGTLDRVTAPFHRAQRLVARSSLGGSDYCSDDNPCGTVDVQGGQPVPFTCSQALGTGLYGVSDDPQFVGVWYDDITSHGFVSPDTTGQHCNSFDPVGSTQTNTGGVNGDGQVVGSFSDSNGDVHGFIYDYGNGINSQQPIQFDIPGATGTWLYSISNNGWILGFAEIPSGPTYFLYDENSDAYVPITSVYESEGLYGLNDNGWIVGVGGSSPNCANGLELTTTLVP